MHEKDKVSVVQQAVDQIKEYIFTHELQAGQKLPSEKDLCAQLSIGRGSLREALRVLAATGYVSLESGRGAFVMRTKEPDCGSDVIRWFETHEVPTNEYLQVRAVFEPLATKLAIERCTEEDYKQLEEIHNRYVQAVEENNFDNVLLEEGNFHETIIRLSGNELLVNIFKLMQQPMINHRYRSLSLPNAPQDALKPHERIVRAFELRDAEYGEACMRNHVALGIRNLNISKENYHKKSTEPNQE